MKKTLFLLALFLSFALLAQTIVPVSAFLHASETQKFVIRNGSGYRWSVKPSVGTITTSGVYTAPGSITQNTVKVLASKAGHPPITAVVTLLGSGDPATPPPDPDQPTPPVIVVGTGDGGVGTGPIKLPIEDVGLDGTTVTVPFDTATGLDTTQTFTIYLQIHNLKYQTEASLRINNSPWVPINDSTVTLLGLAKAYGGIGGEFSTLKLTMLAPAGSIVQGPNAITFRFNGTDGVTSGFRVLAFNISGQNAVPIIASDRFGYDDPTTWTIPLNTPEDIAAGKVLYQTASLHTSMTGSTPNIVAHCNDCHTLDGRDLKYFNYSNQSIRARSMFHGLTSTQGDQIASYIRSLTTPAPGRPWNPPYQPGPGLDGKPVAEWSAGAGLTAVLDTDAAMLPFVSPNLSMADFSADGNLSARETPIALQLPDWNQWLPRIHPLDAFPGLFAQTLTNTDYANLRIHLAPAPTAPTTYAPFRFAISQWTTDRYNFQVSQTPPTADSTWSNPAVATKLYSIGQWQTVKMWELNQEFGLEGQAKVVFGSQADDRAWYTNTPFFTAPSIMRIPVSAAGISNSTKATFQTLSFAWYYLQLILDDSQKTQQCGSSPLDWGYTIASVGNVTLYASAPQAMSLLMIMLKGLQISQNGKGPEFGCTGGWNWRNSIPSTLVTREYTFIWKDLSPTTRTALLNAYVGAWFAVAGSFTPAHYYQGSWTTASEHVAPGFAGSNFASAVAFMVPHMKFWGLDSDLATSIQTWAASMWPNNGYNWNLLTTATCSTDSLGYVHCSTDN